METQIPKKIVIWFKDQPPKITTVILTEDKPLPPIIYLNQGVAVERKKYTKNGTPIYSLKDNSKYSVQKSDKEIIKEQLNIINGLEDILSRQGNQIEALTQRIMDLEKELELNKK